MLLPPDVHNESPPAHNSRPYLLVVAAAVVVVLSLFVLSIGVVLLATM